MQVEITGAGRIGRLGALGATPARRFTGHALLPGFVNAHSHAFQRGLRGRGERFPQGSGSFWTWREEMYRLVESLDEETFLRLSIQAYREMRLSGITTVGEFHYLHHSPGSPDFRFDHLIVRAAAEAGVRLVLLNAYYRTGGIGQPLRAAQERFATASPEVFWAWQDQLAAALDAHRASLGAVVHSIRASTPEEIAEIHAEARRRGMVFHLHLEETQREMEEAIEAYGRRPMELILDGLEHVDNVTAVHCTHTFPRDLESFLERGGRVCVCPLTEANLGDGLPPLDSAGRGLCLGTDSNARIDMTEECRWLEYGQRLRREERGALRDPDGAVAPLLFRIATLGGAESLGVPAGRIGPGAWADFQLLDLDSPALRGCAPDRLLDTWLFGGSADAVTATCVGGVWDEHRPTP